MILKKKIEIIPNNKGNIIKYINKKNNFLKKIKEVYFTEVKKGHIKGWIKHTKTKCFILPVKGKVKFYYSKDLKKKRTIILDSHKPLGILVNPGTWFALESLERCSLLINSIEIYHNPKETIKHQIEF